MEQRFKQLHHPMNYRQVNDRQVSYHPLLWGVILCAALASLWAMTAHRASNAQAAALADAAAFDTPTYSSPIALSATKQQIWVVNPDDDSVSVLGDLDGNPRVIATVRVGDEPQSIALDTDGSPESYHAYVANAADNSVTIITVENSSATSVTIAPQKKTLITGAEPWNIVAAPDGRRVFVANSGQDTVSIIRTDNQSIVGNLDLRTSACNVGESGRHFQPRGLAVTQNSDRLYVTRFLSFTKSGGTQGSDVGKEGIVCQFNIPAGLTDLPTLATTITLAAQDTGFAIDSNGDTQPDPTSAFPNQLQSIVIRGNQAYLPNIAASPSRPLKFNTDTQAFVSVIDNAATGTPFDAGAAKFINLHLGARDPEPPKKKLFFANPWAIAFTNQSGAGNAYVVSAGSDLLVKLNVDATGALSFTVDANTTRYIDLNDPNNAGTSGDSAGKNPLGIVMRNSKAFVMNYISRNVSVVDLATDSVVQGIRTTSLPIPGSVDEQLLVGKEMFFSSRGHFDRPGGTTVSTDERLSSDGWQNCGSCHFAGLTDGVIWQFVPGPRKSIPLNATWSPHNPFDQRMLNYSAVFDEVEDFEINVRNISGPGALATPIAGSVQDPNHGLIISDTGNINFAPAVVNAFTLPNAGRPQHTVTLPGSNTSWPALTALKEWIRFAVRTPNGMLTSDELAGANGNTAANNGALSSSDVAQGRRLFFRANCIGCHGGSKWTNSSKDFTSPPDATEIFTEVGAPNNPVNAQYLDRFLFDIKSFNLGVAGQGNEIGNNVGAVEVATTGQVGLGKDHNGDGKGDGFNTPALLAIWQVPPYYHNGACETLACVLSNQQHRTAGLRQGQSDPLASAANQAKVIAFLQSIDAATTFPLNLYVDRHDIFSDPPKPLIGQSTILGANVSLFGAKADLADLLGDLGLSGVTVKFEVTAGSVSPSEVTVPASAFKQDFGQAIVTTTWTLPTNVTAGLAQVTVTVDPTDAVPEDRENDNSASRRIRLRNAPPDRTPPVVNAILISDDDPFNDADPITPGGSVKVKIKGSDPAGPNGQTVSGLDAYCIVQYTYDQIRRRWVEQACTFQPLPAPVDTDTFIVDAEVEAKAGVAYAFAWLRDKAGNISRRPAFDVISVIPPTAITLDRNDVRIFRIPLASGNLTLNFDVEFGDVDVAVFDDFTNVVAPRCGLSANNGPVDESITLPGNCTSGRYQVEVRAVVNSRFTINVSNGVTAAAMSDEASAKVLQGEFEQPTVAGPPALQTAIEDNLGDSTDLYLPFIVQ